MIIIIKKQRKTFVEKVKKKIMVLNKINFKKDRKENKGNNTRKKHFLSDLSEWWYFVSKLICLKQIKG